LPAKKSDKYGASMAAMSRVLRQARSSLLLLTRPSAMLR
jgi:hypothetical protein